jgi:serine/threonine protein phosphatase PrpC
MNTNNQQQSNPDVESVFQMAVQVEEKKTTRLELQIGKDTDQGGCTYKPNQDRMAVVPFLEPDGCLIAVADGHGPNGEKVAEIAEKMIETLVKEKKAELLENPVAFLENAFIQIHEEIIKEFHVVMCGTTFSVILVLDNKLWIANVGDSTGMLCAKHAIFKPSHLKLEKDVAIEEKVALPSGDEEVKLLPYLILTSEGHSPDNPEEYKRMRAFKANEENPNQAEVICVYDKSGRSKQYCQPAFEISEDGTPIVAPVTEYYVKNVRNDKATYVSDRLGKHVLASTRALGDYAMNLLGVSHKPEIKSLDLNLIFEELKSQIAASGGASEEDPDPMSIAIVLCSDGVWDNWIYDYVQKFMMDKSCLNALVADKERGAQRVCKSFMLRNQGLANKNFGKNSDNATGIVMYITQTEQKE